jgi:hypothetical protein
MHQCAHLFVDGVIQVNRRDDQIRDLLLRGSEFHLGV